MSFQIFIMSEASRWSILIPKIPWDQKLVDCCLGSLCEENYFFFYFFFWTSELHISQALREHRACPIPTPYEPVVKFCSKQVLSLWGAPTYNHVAKTAQGLKGKVLRKKIVFPIEFRFFTFFTSFFFANGSALGHLQCDRYDPNVKFLIFFKKFYKVHSIEVLN
jgi:hypothetical protein